MIILNENRADSNGSSQPNVSEEALPTLPLAPTLAPVLGIKKEADASAISNTCPADAGTEIVRKALEAIPTGSTIAFATDDLGVLFLAGAPIVRGTEAYRKVEHLAQVCNCSFSLHEKAGTVTFHRR